MLELNRLYNMDCMDGMKQFPDKYFELCICGFCVGKPHVIVRLREIPPEYAQCLTFATQYVIIY